MKKIALISFLALAACDSKKGLQTLEWRPGDSASQIQALKNLESTHSLPVQSASQTIELEQQSVHGIKVDGSFIKHLRSPQGEPILIRASVSLEDKKLEGLPLSDFELRKNSILNELKVAFPMFRVRPPEKIDVLIIHHRGYYEPVWNVLYTDKHGIPWEMKLGQHLQIRSVNRVGSQFHDTLAFVFPKGPKISNLQEVLLKGIAVNPTLSSSRLVVTSQAADSKITDIDGPLKYSPQDSRFDQLQVFYFLDESLTWFEKRLNVKLPFSLQAEVAVGAPEKTNSAFYYQSKIRFGTGDDETYSHIPQDPSIVIHESVHALVDALAHLPYEGEGGSLNEAFADFFAALQLDNPNMGEVAYLKGPFRRSLVNDFKLSEKNGGLYHDSGIISGALWDLRVKFGPDKARQIALLTLNRLNPSSDFADFSAQLKEVLSQVLDSDEVLSAQSILGKRGFSL